MDREIVLFALVLLQLLCLAALKNKVNRLENRVRRADAFIASLILVQGKLLSKDSDPVEKRHSGADSSGL